MDDRFEESFSLPSLSNTSLLQTSKLDREACVSVYVGMAQCVSVGVGVGMAQCVRVCLCVKQIHPCLNSKFFRLFYPLFASRNPK